MTRLPITIALVGERWMDLFTADPTVREIGVLYLHCQAAVFPFLLALLRITIAVAGGWLVLRIGDGPVGLFLASSAAFVTFALGLLVITRRRFDSLTRR